MGQFVYDGVDYAQWFDVVGIEMPALPDLRADLRDVPGADGSFLASATAAPFEIKVRARYVSQTIDPRDIQREVSQKLAPMTMAPKPLKLTSDVYRKAVLVKSEMEFATYSATVELTFLCPDPIAYRYTATTVTLTSGGTTTFTVGGNRRTWPRFEARAVYDGTTHLWGLQLDDGPFVRVALPDSTARAIEIDCRNRTVKVAGAYQAPTLDSDFFALEPGQHTIKMLGTTSGATRKMVYYERWA